MITEYYNETLMMEKIDRYAPAKPAPLLGMFHMKSGSFILHRKKQAVQIITCHSYGVLIAWLTFNYKHFTPYGVMERLGTGIPMMIENARAHSGREPLFQELDEEFWVTLYSI